MAKPNISMNPFFLIKSKLAYPQPDWTRCRPIIVNTFNRSHIMIKTWYRIIRRIISIVSCNQHRCVTVDAEEIGCVANSIDFLWRKLWQSGSLESLLLGHSWYSVDHYLWIISIFREYRMSEPTELRDSKYLKNVYLTWMFKRNF